VTEARLYDETIDHVAEGHPEIPIILPSLVTAVQGAITAPTLVENDPARPSAFVFVDEKTTNASGDPLRVPIKVIKGTSGLVKTFYFATSEGPRNIIWRRDDA
jgi:hypothetical protein